MNRLRPASTTSSYTTSASMRPDCGRASSTFSIFTTRAGRFWLGELPAGSPVSGKTGGVVVVVVAGAVDPAVVFFPPPDEQAAATSAKAAARATTETRRRDITALSVAGCAR